MDKRTAKLQEKITEFLAKRSTMTLATVNAEGQPQAAALFFATEDDGSLVFVSSPKSRHGANITLNGRAAVAIHGETWDWKEIAGVQMEGEVHRIPPGMGRERAWEVYKAKFPFVIEFALEVMRSEFYRFVPKWVRLIDNSVRFGYKEEIILP